MMMKFGLIQIAHAIAAAVMLTQYEVFTPSLALNLKLSSSSPLPYRDGVVHESHLREMKPPLATSSKPTGRPPGFTAGQYRVPATSPESEKPVARWIIWLGIGIVVAVLCGIIAGITVVAITNNNSEP
jgi:hypothetical protein